jgi:hypothetical protein
MSGRTFTDEELDALAGRLDMLPRSTLPMRAAYRMVGESADAIAFLRSRVQELEAALDAAHYYIDAHDNELKERGITREDALTIARELRK